MDNLFEALKAYRAALLEQAVDDLLWRHQGAPKDPTKLQGVVDARARVLRLAEHHVGEDLTRHLMAANFLGAP